ncbi:DNA replication/repair protein RecF [Rubrivirga sp. IMCC43871]|uniref:DNA replication/repair protein RecF n=1 Tax=Rubrivirga sp. IMCC43871 TaxID=3391575 RepID=UPI00398FAE10
MRLRHLSLTQFRAHPSSAFDAAPGVNLLVGPNGAGKTNVLEALAYLCFGKSVLGAQDSTVVQRGSGHFTVEGHFEGETRADVKIRVAFVPGEGKRAFINGAPAERLAELVGRVPCVVLSPDDRDLTAGGPVERRKLIDATLSQAYPVYLDDLLKYRRALKQKNALLQQARRGRPLAPGSVDAWDEELALLGGRVVERRREFLDLFAGLLMEAYTLLGEPGGDLSLAYQPSSGEAEPDDTEALRRALARTRRRSRDLGRTMVGPHLDEVVFQIDGFDLRPYASQGQHRTFALAVRVAQALYLRARTEEPPILLLDDVFGPLDPARSDVVLELLASQTLGQSFITAAREEPFGGVVPFDTDAHRAFHVERGALSLADSSLTTPISP